MSCEEEEDEEEEEDRDKDSERRRRRGRNLKGKVSGKKPMSLHAGLIHGRNLFCSYVKGITSEMELKVSKMKYV